MDPVIIEEIAYRTARSVSAYQDFGPMDVGDSEGQPIIETFPALQELIAKAITEYAAATQPKGDDFIIVDGGLVQNDTQLTVFDLDILNSDRYEGDNFLDEVVDLLKRMEAHPTQSDNLAMWIEMVEKTALAEGWVRPTE